MCVKCTLEKQIDEENNQLHGKQARAFTHIAASASADLKSFKAECAALEKWWCHLELHLGERHLANTNEEEYLRFEYSTWSLGSKAIA